MKKRRAVIVAAIGCLIVATLLMIGSRLEREEVILFEVSCNGANHLFAVSPEGKNLRPAIWDEPCGILVSPDGSYMSTQFDGGASLVDLHTNKKRILVRDTWFTSVFSPDSRRVGCIARGRMGDEIITENMDGAERRSFIVQHALDLTFSPDGRHIAFGAGDYPDYCIYTSDYAGRSRRLIARGIGPVFSPDGKTIAFTSERGDKEAVIYLVDSDGSRERLLTTRYPNAVWPMFSRDGRRVLFVGEDKGGHKMMCITDVDGSNQRTLYSGPYIGDASFSPDGDTIAFSTASGIFTVPLSGGKPSLVTSRGGGELYWGATPPIRQKRRSQFPGLPKRYLVDRVISADFDGDGLKEEVCTAGEGIPPDYSDFGAKPKPLLVLVSKNGKLVSKLAHTDKDTIMNLRAVDLTADGRPELTYDSEIYGGSDCTYEFQAHQWVNGAFRNLVGTPSGALTHMAQGGVLAIKNAAHKPSALVLYSFLWDDSNAHYAPHRYWAEWYRLRDGKFVRVARKETKGQYECKNPLVESGITIPSANVTELELEHR